MHENRPVVFVVEDDPSVREAIARLMRSADFEAEVFPSAEAFLARKPRHGPACLLLDVHLVSMDGTELHAQLSDAGSTLPVVFLTGRGDIPMSVQAMKRGAFDFLTKPADDEDLLAAVRGAVELHEHRLREDAGVARVRERVASLSPRELEVMRCVISGALNKRVAAHLSIAEQTVKVDRRQVMAKMEADSLAELVRLCELAGVKPDVVP